MYECMYVCMYVLKLIYIYIYIHTCVYIYMHIHILYTYMHICICIYIYTYTCICILIRYNNVLTSLRASRQQVSLDQWRNAKTRPPASLSGFGPSPVTAAAASIIHMRNLLGWLRLGWLKIYRITSN